jgi:lysophospholipase L1-like esterase
MKRFLCKAAACAAAFGILFGCPAQQKDAPVAATPLRSAAVMEETVVIAGSTAVAAETLPPTPTPTPTQTPIPTPEPTPEPERITLEKLDSGVYDSYFDDALFIGDSLTRTLGGYTRGIRQKDPSFLGGAKFMGTTSMSVKNASTNKAYPGGITFEAKGRAVSVTDGIKAHEAKIVFILLGMNDIGCRRWEDVEEHFRTLIDCIREACPDVQIVIQGILPVTKGYCRSNDLQIEHWNGFNAILAGICAEKDVTFLSFADELMDENGYLLARYADGGYHLNPEGNALWVRALRLYAATQLEPDAVVDIPE